MDPFAKHFRKLFSLLFPLSAKPWLHSRKLAHAVAGQHDEEESVGHNQRQARLEAPYQDVTENEEEGQHTAEPRRGIMAQDEEHASPDMRSSLTVQPSRLQGEDGEWSR